jgi:hypothetical protein
MKISYTLNKGTPILFLVDNDLFEAHVKGKKWCLGGNYLIKRVGGKIVFLHHLVLPRKKGFIIDHINRNTMDNRSCNLRYLSKSFNGLNSKMKKNSTTGHRNINIRKEKRPDNIALEIQFNGKRHRKRFRKIEDAIRYRDEFFDKNNLPVGEIFTRQELV